MAVARATPSASRTLVWTTAANVALPVSAFITSPILARALGPHGRGEMAAVLAPITLAVLVMTFGLPESLTYHVATRRLAAPAAARLALGLGAASGVVAGLAVALLTPVILADYPSVKGLSYALAATLPVIMGVGMLRHVAQGMGRFDISNRERWVWIATRLPLLAAFAVLGLLSVRAAAWITHGTAVLATFALLPAAAGALALRRGTRLRDADVRGVLRYGLRSWTGTLGFMMLIRVDQVLIAPLGGARQLGLYAVAAGAAELPGTALTAVRDVMFATSAERRDPLLAARASRTVVLVLAPLCVAAVAVMPVVVPILFGSSFEGAIAPTQLLLLAAVPAGIDIVLGAGLLAAGRPGIRSVVQMAAAGVLVAGLVVLVPGGGATGGAVAALVARTAGAVMTVIATVRVGGVSAAECFVPRGGDVRALLERVRALKRRGG